MFEPHVGGHIFDRAVDGSECRWARILAYEPPDRVVFSWDISPYWHSKPTPITPARSRSGSWPRHRSARGWSSSTAIERHGPGWDGVRDGVDGDAGWPLYLARYAALLTKAE